MGGEGGERGDGWHRRLNGHKFEQTPGGSEGQGSLVSMGLQRVRHDLATKQQQQSLTPNFHIVHFFKSTK